MSIIYEPRGKAREYSPLALNLYIGCTHKCAYCYAPSCLMKSHEDYFSSPAPRAKFINTLGRELEKKSPKKQVLLSFIGDVYCEAQDNNALTRAALEVLLDAKVPVAILTKGGSRCLKDIDLFKKFGDSIQVGATLTFDNDKDSLEWEPGAALPSERLSVLKKLRDAGIKTFASFEPVIKPEQSLNLMRLGLDFIDVFKVGKLNNYKGLDKQIDWTSFLQSSVDLLRSNGKQFYIKHDLRKSADSVELFGNEAVADSHNVGA